ncbi:hypothetical protein AB9M75_11835 [Lactobacillus sp. AN1001]
MEWAKKTTIHFSKSDLVKLEEIEQYFGKQEYFSNEMMTKSRMISVMVNTFYDLFVSDNSRTKYQNRVNELKKIKSKTDQKIWQEVRMTKHLQEWQLYILLASYQNLMHINSSYSPSELQSYQFGTDNTINNLMKNIAGLIEGDIAKNKQIKDSKKKKS